MLDIVGSLEELRRAGAEFLIADVETAIASPISLSLRKRRR